MSTEQLIGKIEKLIIDGQKEVLGRLDKLEAGQHSLEAGQHSLEAGQHNLEAGQQRLEKKLDSVHLSLKHEIMFTAMAVKDELKADIKRVESKLDAHIKQPAHA